jgi:hypothetical protein
MNYTSQEEKLNNRILYIKKVLKCPYHIWALVGGSKVDKPMRKLWLEDRNGKSYPFIDSSIENTVTQAEKYIESEIKAGALKDVKQKENEKN